MKSLVHEGRRRFLAGMAAPRAFIAALAGASPAASAATIAGYADPISAAPSETDKLHVSTTAKKFSYAIDRIGASTTPATQGSAQGTEHPVPADASSLGCGWPSSVSVTVDPSWKSGYYRVRFTTAATDSPDGKPAQSEAFFVVRSARPGQTAKILLQLSTNTYNAYNNWGGYSLYAYNGKDKVQGRRVSFLRPPASQFANWEQPFVAWAEQNGYALDYAVNLDLEMHPELLKHYPLILSVGHDEYWSKGMRDNLEAYIGAGGNVAFFSGNAVCWQVRPEENGRALTCWKQAYQEDPIYKTKDHSTLSTLWSHHLVKRPENQLTGVGFLWGGYHRSHGQFMDGPGSYQTRRPDHWVFEGANVKDGTAFGGKDTIVGYECDGCEIVMKDGKPVPTHRDGTPESFVILADSPARWHPDDCEWYERWEKGRTGQAVMGIHQRGGTVFTAGTTDWSHGLKGNDPVVVRVTRNLLDRLSRGESQSAKP